jgi:hypothetical protein
MAHRSKGSIFVEGSVLHSDLLSCQLILCVGPQTLYANQYSSSHRHCLRTTRIGSSLLNSYGIAAPAEDNLTDALPSAILDSSSFSLALASVTGHSRHATFALLGNSGTLIEISKLDRAVPTALIAATFQGFLTRGSFAYSIFDHSCLAGIDINSNGTPTVPPDWRRACTCRWKRWVRAALTIGRVGLSGRYASRIARAGDARRALRPQTLACASQKNGNEQSSNHVLTSPWPVGDCILFTSA